MRKMTLFAFLALSLCARPVLAQLPDETSGRVPELDAFHKPIYELWHTAWPAKDIAALKKLMPDVEKAYTSLAAAKLPGILREKKAKWDEKLQVLAQSVKEYNITSTSSASERAGEAHIARDAISIMTGRHAIASPLTRRIISSIHAPARAC